MTAGFSVRRILLAVEAGGGAPEAVQSAAELAARLGAELEILVVEDTRLLQTSALPYVRHVTVAGHRHEPEAAAIEREMRAFAANVRRIMEQSAAPRGIAWRMRVSRGELIHEVVAAAEQADLVVLESVSRPVVPHLRIASAARAALKRLLQPVVLMPPGMTAAEHVVVLYEDGPAADDVLRSVIDFARMIRAELSVLVHADTREARAGLETRARELLSARGVAALIVPIADADAAAICARVSQTPRALLAMAAESLARRTPAERELIDRLDCPLLVVR